MTDILGMATSTKTASDTISADDIAAMADELLVKETVYVSPSDYAAIKAHGNVPCFVKESFLVPRGTFYIVDVSAIQADIFKTLAEAMECEDEDDGCATVEIRGA